MYPEIDIRLTPEKLIKKFRNITLSLLGIPLIVKDETFRVINMQKSEVPISPLVGNVILNPLSTRNNQIVTRLSYQFTEDTFTQVFYTINDISSAIGGFFALIGVISAKLAVFSLIFYFYSMIKVIKKDWILKKHKNDLKILKGNLPELEKIVESRLIIS